jgi:hypothetical protein
MAARLRDAAGFGGRPSAQPTAMVASDWRAIERGTLRGFFDLQLASGMKLRECTLHAKGDSRWIGLPGKPVVNKEGQHKTDSATGKRAYVAIVEIPSRKRRESYQRQALAAVDQLLGEEEPS